MINSETINIYVYGTGFIKLEKYIMYFRKNTRKLCP